MRYRNKHVISLLVPRFAYNDADERKSTKAGRSRDLNIGRVCVSVFAFSNALHTQTIKKSKFACWMHKYSEFIDVIMDSSGCRYIYKHFFYIQDRFFSNAKNAHATFDNGEKIVLYVFFDFFKWYHQSRSLFNSCNFKLKATTKKRTKSKAASDGTHTENEKTTTMF